MRTLVMDCFEGQALRGAMAKMSITWALAPIISPAIGGWIQTVLNWHWQFYILSSYGALAFLLVFFIGTETLSSRDAGPWYQPLHNYHKLLCEPVLIVGAIGIGAAYALFTLFHTLAPQILQVHLHLNPIEYGATFNSKSQQLGSQSKIH